MKRTDWEALSADERRAFGNPEAKCYEPDCLEPAGTPWGPHWCADHDDERIHRISGQLTEIQRTVTTSRGGQ